MTEETLVVDTSFSQQSLWLQNRIDPGQAAYNVTAAVRLRGPLDVGALERALNTVVARHEVLRTVFDLDEGEPVQVIGPTAPLRVTVTDCSPEDLEETAREELAAPFDLREGPLVRLRLLRLGERDHLALLVMHHIVTDGASSGIFFQELTAAYQAHLAGAEPRFAELPIQYADFAVWQREHLSGDRLRELTGYWSGALAGAVACELPTDRPRPAVLSDRGGTHHFTVPDPLVRRLEALARRRNATPFMVLLAAFDVLLARYSGQHDITVTSPMSGRTRPELEGLIGYFVNPLMLRTDMSGDPAFSELLDRVRDVCLGAYRHQELPFEQATDLIRRQGASARPPGAQVMLVLQAKAPLRWESAGLEFEMTHIDTGTAKADLALDVRPGDAGHHVVLQYSADLFDASTAERIGAHFVSVLEAVADRPERAVSELALLSAEERDTLLTAWNAPGADPVEGRVSEAVAEWALRTPDAPAVVAGDGVLDHAGLDRRAGELARVLERSGVRAGTPVALVMAPSCALVVGALAVLKAGGAPLAVDPSLPGETVRRVVARSGAPVVLTEDGPRPADASGDAAGYGAHGAGEAGHGAHGAEEAGHGAHGAGEAGHGAGEVALWSWAPSRDGAVTLADLGHGAVLTAARDVAAHLSLVPSDRWWCGSRRSEHVLRQMFPVLLRGATLLLPGAPGEEFATASVLSLAGTAPADLPVPPATATRVVVGDAPETVRRAVELVGDGPARVVRLLDLPETAGPVAWGDAGSAAGPTSWRRLPGHDLHVLDEHLEPVPLGVTGELCVAGPPIGPGPGSDDRPGSGSGDRPAPADRSRPAGPCRVPDPHASRPGALLLRTGERARRRPDGTLELLGRTDGLWLADGLRLDPREAETVLGALPGVAACAVLPRPVASGGFRPVAYVVAAPGEQLDPPALLDALAEELPAACVPAGIVALDALPRTAAGDLDVAALPLPEAAPAGGAAGHIAPRTPLETEIARMWEEILEVEDVGASDNFFDLGGHSLTAVRLASRIRDDLGVDLAMRDLYADFTVAEVAWKVLQRLVEEPAGADVQMGAVAGTEPAGTR
ncbi:condensation domain-containing protein [Streptomyces fragilis]|uniref:Condensation domain-containing protein n=1 Tax=Streptomyces fragilis TaxID=67301 RepID=A0ABV2YGH5_9ACTN|nr:condensation domain-containing protein [Streptomyces fragilis]